MNINEVIKHLQMLSEAGYGERPLCFDTEGGDFNFHCGEIESINSLKHIKQMDEAWGDYNYPISCRFNSHDYGHHRLLCQATRDEVLEQLEIINSRLEPALGETFKDGESPLLICIKGTDHCNKESNCWYNGKECSHINCKGRERKDKQSMAFVEITQTEF